MALLASLPTGVLSAKQGDIPLLLYPSSLYKKVRYTLYLLRHMNLALSARASTATSVVWRREEGGEQSSKRSKGHKSQQGSETANK